MNQSMIQQASADLEQVMKRVKAHQARQHENPFFQSDTVLRECYRFVSDRGEVLLHLLQQSPDMVEELDAAIGRREESMTTLRDKVLAVCDSFYNCEANRHAVALAVARLVMEHCAGVCDVAQHRDEEIAANQDNAYGERCAAKAFRAASIAIFIRKELWEL